MENLSVAGRKRVKKRGRLPDKIALGEPIELEIFSVKTIRANRGQTKTHPANRAKLSRSSGRWSRLWQPRFVGRQTFGYAERRGFL